ncbi:alcohol dehydrogenase catalytic domain-containing protein [Pseudarthrobacter sp. H2]|uniref:alcohol dehydrogenase catalytic domain-containing protein n=1 Tax=Pseudarthrobacter sp. H2 TaxID=3418415 RepID=UPI003CF5F7AF
MKAIRIHGEGDLRIEELLDPSIAPGMVLLTGGYTGVCGTDLHLYFESEIYPADFSQPATLTGATWPQIFGHEFSGEVAQVGPDVTNLKPGDRVAVFPYYHCGHCLACEAGHATDCEHMAFEGIQGRSGGMAQSKLVPAELCFALPEEVDLVLGALVEPMAVAWHGVNIADVMVGDSALVLGGGPIGIGAFFALRARGVEQIIVSEPSAQRRAVLERVGIHNIIDPTSQNLQNEVRQLTAGRGVAATIDTAGSPLAFVEGMQSLAVGGRMVTIAMYKESIPLTRSLLVAGRSIRSSVVYSHEDFRAVIDAMRDGTISLEGEWVRLIEFADITTAMEQLRSGGTMKVLVRTPVD